MRNRTAVRRALACSRGAFSNLEIVHSLYIICGLLLMTVFGLAVISLNSGEGFAWSATYTMQALVAAVLLVAVGTGAVRLHRREIAAERAETGRDASRATTGFPDTDPNRTP